jgi:predicted GNAT family acetyltransferase
MDLTVRDNPDRHRFELLTDGEVAGVAAYRVRDGVTVITHSEVDPRDHRARVVPACPFFGRYVAEHPEYADLIED